MLSNTTPTGNAIGMTAAPAPAATPAASFTPLALVHLPSSNLVAGHAAALVAALQDLAVSAAGAAVRSHLALPRAHALGENELHRAAAEAAARAAIWGQEQQPQQEHHQQH